ncbi:MAG: hypothetical protein HKP13_04865 [Gammaproteobacteria bacterium]|nr:hypothetical protein [Gammaproteobacteria bacterium]
MDDGDSHGAVTADSVHQLLSELRACLENPQSTAAAPELWPTASREA